MIGQTVGRYRILERIGTGGMGEVYRAQDDRLRRTVAIKVLPKEIASRAEGRARILAEARAAAALNHPSIVTIYEVSEQDEQVFIVMELVAGKTLRELLLQQPLEAKAIAGQALDERTAAAAVRHWYSAQSTKVGFRSSVLWALSSPDRKGLLLLVLREHLPGVTVYDGGERCAVG